MQKILLTTALLCALASAQTPYYRYNYQNYPLHFDALYQGRPPSRGPYGGNTPLDNMMLQSVMRSLLAPGVDPNRRVTRTNFLKEWNNRFGYNFMSLEAVQENIGCRARCRRLSESPVCGDNKTRYFNSCDAECDQVTSNTSNLRYNNTCCCYDNQMALTAMKVFCVVGPTWKKGTGTLPNMIVNSCLYECLTKMGHSLTQGSDVVRPC